MLTSNVRFLPPSHFPGSLNRTVLEKKKKNHVSNAAFREQWLSNRNEGIGLHSVTMCQKHFKLKTHGFERVQLVLHRHKF